MQHSMKMLAALGVVALALTGCAAGGGDAPADGEPIVIGTSLPMTGPLASFGPILEAGYQAAVDDVNAAGGIEIDGTAHQVELTVLDSGSDPNAVAEQARTLVLQDGAVGLLGSVSPGLTIPASNVADLEGVPMVSSLTPNGAWAAGNPDGWQFAWNFFMDEHQLADVAYETADLTDTNKKVAIFADTEEDGVATGALYESAALEYGYEIVYRADNPAGTTDFTADINAAKAAGAEVLLAILIPPDAFALWKQMAALEYVPEIAVCQKCSSTAAFQAELGDLADHYEELRALGVEVYSVSTDTHFTHKAWHEASDTIRKVTYPMVGDPTQRISKNFKILRKAEGLADRGTFLVDPDGVIQFHEVTAEGIGRNAAELVRKVKAAQYVRNHPGEVCPAKWEEGEDTLAPSLDLVGKI